MVNSVKLSDAYCVCKRTIGAANGLSPGWRQVIIWTNAGMVLTGLLGTNFGETLIETSIFSFKKMHLKMSFAFFFVSASMRWELARRIRHESDSIMFWSMMARE